MLSSKTDIKHFLELAETVPVIDVRSPGEYIFGHIPGAINIPLFDDEQRAAVGTKYKKQGRIPAIIEGMKRSGPEMSGKLEKALGEAKNNQLLVHCWRGGMRSEAMAWLFSLGNIQTHVLEGGYKSYRNYILNGLSEKKKMLILGGMTGSSKTRILRFLGEKGHQMIDLESLANHKGSAFGSLGQSPQPSTEQFANNLFENWKKLDPDRPVWMEDESRNIGTVFMPESFYLNIQDSRTIVLLMDTTTRLPGLIEEYSTYPSEALKASVMKISRRLGGDNAKNAIEAIDNGDFARAIEISLFYYDKAYQYSLRKKASKNLVFVHTNTDDVEVNAMKILDVI